MNIHPNMFLSRRLPMLLIPTNDTPESPRSRLPDGHVYDLISDNLRLPVPYNTRKGNINFPPFPAARDFCQSVQNDVTCSRGDDSNQFRAGYAAPCLRVSDTRDVLHMVMLRQIGGIQRFKLAKLAPKVNHQNFQFMIDEFIVPFSRPM
ncbi:hypothetical protein KSS87_017644 [Heliosperma pusillum]|nr:hypothetical protein KSS87_017644 [Heliosperma pusillum]